LFPESAQKLGPPENNIKAEKEARHMPAILQLAQDFVIWGGVWLVTDGAAGDQTSVLIFLFVGQHYPKFSRRPQPPTKRVFLLGNILMRWTVGR
jgi:hypothetical protein